MFRTCWNTSLRQVLPFLLLRELARGPGQQGCWQPFENAKHGSRLENIETAIIPQWSELSQRSQPRTRRPPGPASSGRTGSAGPSTAPPDIVQSMGIWFKIWFWQFNWPFLFITLYYKSVLNLILVLQEGKDAPSTGKHPSTIFSAKVGSSLQIACQVSSYRGRPGLRQLLITQGSHSSRFYNFQYWTLVRPDRLDG